MNITPDFACRDMKETSMHTETQKLKLYIAISSTVHITFFSIGTPV